MVLAGQCGVTRAAVEQQVVPAGQCGVASVAVDGPY